MTGAVEDTTTAQAMDGEMDQGMAMGLIIGEEEEVVVGVEAAGVVAVAVAVVAANCDRSSLSDKRVHLVWITHSRRKQWISVRIMSPAC